MELIGKRIHLSMGESYIIKAEDVGCTLPCDFGRVLTADVGKKITKKGFGLTMENAEQRDARIAKERYDVKGDHPTLARPDKNGLPKAEAETYAEELRRLGYENVTVTPHRTVAKSPHLAAPYGEQAQKPQEGWRTMTLADIFTDAQLCELTATLKKLEKAKLKPFDTGYTNELKRLFTPWKDELEQKGIAADYLAYAVAYLVSKGEFGK